MLRQTSSVLLLAAALCAAASPARAQSDVVQTALHDYRVVTVADGFEIPWSIAFLPDGDILVTEKVGRLRIIRNGSLLPDPVAGVPEVLVRGQGGLMDVVPHPDFANNRMLYLSYSKDVDGVRGGTTVVARGTFVNDRFNLVDEIFQAVSEGGSHYGCRLAFDSDGYLFLSVGDRQVPPRGDLAAHPAQDVSDHHGVIIRLNDDGSVPDDNPFVGQAGARPEIWSYGHRNPQGLVIDPETDAVWLTEHGPQGGDEVNVSAPGANFGWPVIGYGGELPLRQRDSREHARGREWSSPCTSGSRQSAFPAWPSTTATSSPSGGEASSQAGSPERGSTGSPLMAGASPGARRSSKDGAGVRDVREGPDGYIYIALERRGGDLTPIVRLEPVG